MPPGAATHGNRCQTVAGRTHPWRVTRQRRRHFRRGVLVRPALERLRDVVSFSALDRLYVHSPDRLARSYAHQVLLLEEFARAGVEVVFLNRLRKKPETNAMRAIL